MSLMYLDFYWKKKYIGVGKLIIVVLVDKVIEECIW